jgi:hypothetical protein
VPALDGSPAVATCDAGAAVVRRAVPGRCQPGANDVDIAFVPRARVRRAPAPRETHHAHGRSGREIDGEPEPVVMQNHGRRAGDRPREDLCAGVDERASSVAFGARRASCRLREVVGGDAGATPEWRRLWWCQRRGDGCGGATGATAAVRGLPDERDTMRRDFQIVGVGNRPRPAALYRTTPGGVRWRSKWLEPGSRARPPRRSSPSPVRAGSS